MTTNFLTPILDKFTAELNEAVTNAQAEIFATLAGLPVAIGNAPKRESLAKGAKRSPEDIEALTGKLHGYILKHPGQRIEQIAVGLDCDTKTLRLPMLKLRKAKRVSVKGAKRAASYTAR